MEMDAATIAAFNEVIRNGNVSHASLTGRIDALMTLLTADAESAQTETFSIDMAAADAEYSILKKLYNESKKFRDLHVLRKPELAAHKKLKNGTRALGARIKTLRDMYAKATTGVEEVPQPAEADEKRKADAVAPSSAAASPAPKRLRTKAPRQPTEGDTLTPESIVERKKNAEHILTDLRSFRESIFDSTEKSASILKNLVAFINIVSEARAFLYSPLELYTSIRDTIKPMTADKTDWLHIVQTLADPANTEDSPLFVHYMEKHLRDATLRLLLKPGLTDEELATEVDRSLLALVELVASPDALAEKHKLFDDYKAYADDGSDNNDIDDSDASGDDPDAMDIGNPLLLALQGAAYGAGGKAPKGAPLSGGARRRILDFYALTALHGFLTNMYNALVKMGATQSRTLDDMIRASVAMDRLMLSGLALFLDDKVRHDTLSTATLVEALGATRKSPMYVPSALWHLRSAFLSDLVAAYTEASLSVPNAVANRYDFRSKKWEPRTAEDQATEVLPLAHLILDGSLEKEALRWPQVLIDAAFVWPAIGANEGLQSLSIQHTGARLVGTVWPLMSLFDRRSKKTRLLIGEAPATTMPAPWSNLFTTRNNQKTCLLRNLRIIQMVKPLTAPVAMTLAVLRLTHVTLEHILDNWDSLGTREKERWQNKALVEFYYDASMRASAIKNKKEPAADTPVSSPAPPKASDEAVNLLRVDVRGAETLASAAGDILNLFIGRVASIHETKVAERTADEREKVGHGYDLRVTKTLAATNEQVVEDSGAMSPNSSVVSPERAKARKEPLVPTTPSIALPTMPPFSSKTFDNAKLQEALRAVYGTFWTRRVEEFSNNNAVWLDDPNLVPAEVQPLLPEILAILGLNELANAPTKVLPAWARIDEATLPPDLRSEAPTHSPDLLAEEAPADAATATPKADALASLAWLRYYRFMNQLAAVVSNTDTISGYTLSKDDVNKSDAEDKSVGSTFPIVSAPQGAMLWSEWNVDVRTSDANMEEQAVATSMGRDIPSLDIVPTPWTRGFDAERNEVIFEFNPYSSDEGALPGTRSTKPKNWFTELATLYATVDETTVVDPGTLHGLHALAMVMPALVSSEEGVADALVAMNSAQNETTTATRTELTRKRRAELENAKASLKKKLASYAKDSADRTADDIRIRIVHVDNELSDLAKQEKRIKKAKNANRNVVLLHEDFPDHTHASALVILQFHAAYLDAVGGQLRVTCVRAGSKWLLTYTDRLLGQNRPLPLLHIEWLADARKVVHSDRIRASCPTETLSLLTGACASRTLLARAQLTKPPKTIGDASRRAELASLLYSPARDARPSLAQVAATLAADMQKNADKKKEWNRALAPFLFVAESERAWPDVSTAIHGPLASALSFAAKLRLLVTADDTDNKSESRAAARKAIKGMAAAELSVLLGKRDIEDEESMKLPSYGAADTAHKVSTYFRAMLATDPDEDELLEAFHLLIPPEMPEDVENSDALATRAASVRTSLYARADETMSWVYVRNDLLSSGLIALALMHLASHLAPAEVALDADAMDIDGPAVSMAGAEYEFTRQAAAIVGAHVLPQVIAAMGPLDMTDLALDYSPLAYQTLVTTTQLFGIPDAEAWYGLPETINRNISIKDDTSRLDRAIGSVEGLVREFSTAFRLYKSEFDIVPQKNILKLVPYALDVDMINAHARALTRFAAVLLSVTAEELPTDATHATIPIIRVDGNLLTGALEDADISTDMMKKRQASRFSFGRITDKISMAEVSDKDRRSGIREQAAFILEFLAEIKRCLLNVFMRIAPDNVDRALRFLGSYVKAAKQVYMDSIGAGDGDDAKKPAAKEPASRDIKRSDSAIEKRSASRSRSLSGSSSRSGSGSSSSSESDSGSDSDSDSDSGSESGSESVSAGAADKDETELAKIGIANAPAVKLEREISPLLRDSDRVAQVLAVLISPLEQSVRDRISAFDSAALMELEAVPHNPNAAALAEGKAAAVKEPPKRLILVPMVTKKDDDDDDESSGQLLDDADILDY